MKRKLFKIFLTPPLWILIVFTPVSAVALIYSFLYSNPDSPLSICSYVLSAYVLTVWCIKTPELIKLGHSFKKDNKYAKLWAENARFRVNASLIGLLLFNCAYAALQLWLGFFYNTFWFYSFAIYYVLLAVMRFFLLKHTRLYKANERMREELKKYRLCGIVLLLMNLTLAIIVFFMIYWNRTFRHDKITTIAMAAYTFSSFGLAIFNTVKYRKYKSPIYSASKIISLTSASVSVLTLESTMLTTFGSSDSMDMNRIMLGITGALISAFIITTAIYMIYSSTKKLRSKEY